MYLEVVEDELGSCFKCGMDLVVCEVGGDVDVGEYDYFGYGYGDYDYGDYDYGSLGFMFMVEVIKDLFCSVDGLVMDWFEVFFGFCFFGLLGGLRLILMFDGDGVIEG